jgi:hypothetical protein
VLLDRKEIKRQKDKERYASMSREQKYELNRKARERRVEKKDVIRKSNVRKVHVWMKMHQMGHRTNVLFPFWSSCCLFCVESMLSAIEFPELFFVPFCDSFRSGPVVQPHGNWIRLLGYLPRSMCIGRLFFLWCEGPGTNMPAPSC